MKTLARSKASRTTRLILLLFITVFLSGCTVKVAYHFLDWGLQYKLNHYLSLNSEQSQLAKKTIKEFHHWHQRYELPTYVTFLKDARTRLSGPALTASEIGVYRERIKKFGEQSLDPLLPAIATLLKSLDAKQKQRLFKTLNEDQKDYEDLYLKPPMDEIRESLKNDALKSIKKYMGRLTDTQKNRIGVWSESIQPFGAAASSEQDKWEQLMAKLLDHPDEADFSTQLKSLLMYDFASWDEAHRKIMEHNQTASYELMADMLNSRSPEQQASLIEKLDVYIEDCEDLIRQAQQEDSQTN
ncbi:MAG TPA: DUF6279 family lipoprotein [Cellvibrionaceae bacterium]